MGCACAQIVRSLAGHDRGGLFCVLDTDGPYLLPVSYTHLTLPTT